MAAHVGWTMFLYILLTLFRAPTAWNIGKNEDGTNPWSSLEVKVSANLSNQFEWPLFFYVACIIMLITQEPQGIIFLTCAWLFVLGRIIHSGVQILTNNIRLRGIVFTINFLAVIAMWVVILLQYWQI